MAEITIPQICEIFHCDSVGLANGGEVELRESDQNVDYIVRLSNVPEDCIIVKMDRFEARAGFFSESCELPVGKRADYALIDMVGQKIVVVELKKGTYENGHVRSQLSGGAALFDYLSSLLKWHADCENLFKGFCLHFVVIGKKSASRKTTRNQFSNTSPNHFLKVVRRNGEPIPFRMLIN